MIYFHDLTCDEREAEIASNPALSAKVEPWERNFVLLDLAAERVRPDVDLFAVILDAHHHPHGHEECLLLEGDLSFGDLIPHAGDFHIAYAHSVHPVATTRTGCLLHVSTAL